MKLNQGQATEKEYLTSELLQNAFYAKKETKINEILLYERVTEDDFLNFDLYRGIICFPNGNPILKKVKFCYKILACFTYLKFYAYVT